LWYELKPFGISVTVVRPGFINSDGHTHVKVSPKANLAEKLRGPYHDFYTFMRPFVEKLMNLSSSTSDGIADDIMKIIKTQKIPVFL
jgi:short-subunit dehydrogenase